MKLRWGICGAGAICNDFCHAFNSLPAGENEIVAIASRTAGKAKSYADTFSIRKSYSTYGEIAADSEIDIVYIATWAPSHIPLTKMMLTAGKHVLCETPMGYTADEVKEVFQLAKEKKLFLMEALWSRAYEIYADIRTAIDQGEIGEIKMVTSNFCYHYMDGIKGIDEGGGNCFEQGIYNVQFVNWIFKNEKPKDIKVLASIGKKGVDEDACIVMSYENGAMASISSSFKCHGVNYGYVFGNKGKIVIPDYFWCPEHAIIPSGNKSYPITPKDQSVYNFPNSHGLQKEIALVRRCVMEGLIECPVMTKEDSIAIHEIVDEVLRQIPLKYDTEKILKISGAF